LDSYLSSSRRQNRRDGWIQQPPSSHPSTPASQPPRVGLWSASHNIDWSMGERRHPQASAHALHKTAPNKVAFAIPSAPVEPTLAWPCSSATCTKPTPYTLPLRTRRHAASKAPTQQSYERFACVPSKRIWENDGAGCGSEDGLCAGWDQPTAKKQRTVVRQAGLEAWLGDSGLEHGAPAPMDETMGLKDLTNVVAGNAVTKWQGKAAMLPPARRATHHGSGVYLWGRQQTPVVGRRGVTASESGIGGSSAAAASSSGLHTVPAFLAHRQPTKKLGYRRQGKDRQAKLVWR